MCVTNKGRVPGWKTRVQAQVEQIAQERSGKDSPKWSELGSARLNRDDEAAQEWRRLLRMKPDHAYAASEFISSLPLENTAKFESALESLGEPETLVAGAAGNVGMQDYERLLMIAEYVNREAPNSAAARSTSPRWA